MALDATAVLTLQALEESMWRAETRFDASYMQAILDPDFSEVGQSGRIYTREETLELQEIAIDITLPLLNFSAAELAEGVAHVTYTSVPERSTRGVAHRSSIWINRNGWKLRYHQATVTEL